MEVFQRKQGWPPALSGNGLEGLTDARSRVASCCTLSNRMDKYSRNSLPYPMSCLDRAALLDLPKNRKHHGFVDLANRKRSEPRKDLVLEALNYVSSVDGSPPTFLDSEPSPRQNFEGVRPSSCHLHSLLLRLDPRVSTFVEQLSRLRFALPGFLQ